jgi:hypothetical protein
MATGYTVTILAREPYGLALHMDADSGVATVSRTIDGREYVATYADAVQGESLAATVGGAAYDLNPGQLGWLRSYRRRVAQFELAAARGELDLDSD